MNSSSANALQLIGRIALALVFIIAGFGKLTGFAGSVGYAAKYGVPLPEVAIVISICIELGGGLLLLLGWKARWAAAALAVFLIVISPIFHHFWSVDPAQVGMQQTNFLKNLAILGGMLYVMAVGAGAYSIDGRRSSSGRTMAQTA